MERISVDYNAKRCHNSSWRIAIPRWIWKAKSSEYFHFIHFRRIKLINSLTCFSWNEAVTICNMNQAMKSVVDLLNVDEEYAIVQSICRYSVNTHVKNSVAGKWEAYKEVLLKVCFKKLCDLILLSYNCTNSLFKVSQPCDKMIVSCQFGHVDVNCSRVFNSILTDGGLCCIFNGLHKKFMMHHEYNNFISQSIKI